MSITVGLIPINGFTYIKLTDFYHHKGGSIKHLKVDIFYIDKCVLKSFSLGQISLDVITLQFVSSCFPVLRLVGCMIRTKICLL